MRLIRPAVIIALAVACYANALPGAFHFDDRHAVRENPSIRSLANVGRFFSDVTAFSVMPQNQSYRPVLLVSYAATATFTGVEPAAFIAVNLAVHAACALLVLVTLREVLRLIGREANAGAIAFLAAAIFAVHPITAECVNYVSARSESLSAALLLASMYAYLCGRRDERWMTLAVLAIAAAMLTKPTAVVLPVLLALLEAAAALRRPLRQIAPWLGAITGVVLVLSAVGIAMTPDLTLQATSGFTRAEYLRSELPAYGHYVRVFLWPAGLNPDPDFPVARSFLEPRVIASGLALLAVAAFAAWGLGRRRRTGLALAIAWFVLCLAPSSSVFPLAEIVNGHRPYLAAAGLCALAAWLLVEPLPRALRLEGARARAATGVASALLIGALGTATVLHNRVWRTEETLWTHVVGLTPGSTRAQTNLGLAQMFAGKPDEAEARFREALRLSPDHPYAHIGLGCVLLERDPPEAASHLDRAIALEPTIFWGHYYRGVAGERLAEPPEQRIERLLEATRLSPDFADAWYELARARDAAGDPGGALEAGQRAAALRGSYDDRLLLAALLLGNGNVQAARRLLERLQLEQPGEARARKLIESAARAAPRG